MVKFLKNNKLNLVYIGIILVLSIICIFFLIDKCLSNKNKKVVCTMEQKEINNVITETITYDKTGRVLDDEYKITVTYEDDNVYNAAKEEIAKNAKDYLSEYKYNEKARKITHTYKADYTTKDEDGNDVYDWYFTHVKTAEKSGYICK